LKGALEDSIPKGKMVPEIISMDMPEFLPEEGQRQFSSGELENLQNKNAMLEKQIEKLNIKLETMKESRQGADINSRILEEIQLLKANPRTISRPGTATLEIDSLRKERNELLEENRRLKRIVILFLYFSI
jgi:dynactin complex subunit